MADAWGGSWGSSWGDSWGAGADTPAVTTAGKSAATSYRAKTISRELREAALRKAHRRIARKVKDEGLKAPPGLLDDMLKAGLQEAVQATPVVTAETVNESLLALDLAILAAVRAAIEEDEDEAIALLLN